MIDLPIVRWVLFHRAVYCGVVRCGFDRRRLGVTMPNDN